MAKIRSVLTTQAADGPAPSLGAGGTVVVFGRGTVVVSIPVAVEVAAEGYDGYGAGSGEFEGCGSALSVAA